MVSTKRGSKRSSPATSSSRKSTRRPRQWPGPCAHRSTPRHDQGMPVHLNHTIVAARDKRASAQFMIEMLGLKSEPTPFGPFIGVETDNEVTIDFVDAGPDDVIEPRHFA